MIGTIAWLDRPHAVHVLLAERCAASQLGGALQSNMNGQLQLRWAFAVAFVLCTLMVRALAWGDPAQPKVYSLPIDGTIDMGLAPFVERSLREAEQQGARAVILDMATLGGRLDAGLAIRDAVLETPLRTVAFIRKRAISAGALIAISTTKIAMADGATIGAATPVRLQGSGETTTADEKTVSYVRKEFKATAERRGRSPEIAEAMVDASTEIPDLVEKGKLLTLTASEALQRKFVDFQANDLRTLLRQLDLENAEVVRVAPSWAERVVRFITNPALASILMSLGLLGLLVELRTPGFGAPGLVGVACLGLFFWGHFIARLAGLEELALIVVGVVLLALEILVIPGFGIAGIAGLLSLGTGLVLSLLGVGVTGSAVLGAVTRTLLSLVVTLVLFVALLRFLPRVSWGRRMVLQSSLGSDAVAEASSTQWAGKQGVSLSPLRPSGVVALSGLRLDAVTEGEFVEAGEIVEVVREFGNRIVVRRVESSGEVGE